MLFLPSSAVFRNIPPRAGNVQSQPAARAARQGMSKRAEAKPDQPSKQIIRGASASGFRGIGAGLAPKPSAPAKKATKLKSHFQGVGGKYGNCDAIGAAGSPVVSKAGSQPTESAILAGWDAAFARARNPFAKAQKAAIGHGWDEAIDRLARR